MMVKMGNDLSKIRLTWQDQQVAMLLLVLATPYGTFIQFWREVKKWK